MSVDREQGFYPSDLDRFTGVIEDGVVRFRNVIGEETDQTHDPVASELTLDTTEAGLPLPASIATELESTPSEASSESLTIGQAYAGIIHRGVDAYCAARQKRENDRVVLREHQRGIESRLARLYEAYPHLSPEKISMMQAAESAYLAHIDVSVRPATPPEVTMVEATYAPGADWTHKLAIATAVASMRQFDGATTHRNFAAAIHQPVVHVPVRRYLNHHLGLFRCGGVKDLSDKELKSYGLTKESLDAYSQLPRLLPEDNIPELPQLAAPPLHLTQLAVDVLNRNATSVMPTGFQTKLPGNRQPVGIKSLADATIDALSGYIARRYDYNTPPSRRMVSVLAECDLAERQGFLTASAEAQYRTANRVHGIFSKVKPDQVPASARKIFDHCRAITTIPR